MRFLLGLFLAFMAERAAAQPTAWTAFSDPLEGAFSLEIPQGWTVEGGTVRHSSISAALFLRALSPDRRTYLLLGDPSLGLFTTPTQFQAAQGVPDGQPAGGLVIRRYVSGSDFARDYALRGIATLCGNLRIVVARPRPDLAQGPWAAGNPPPMAQHEAGEVDFTCTRQSAAGSIPAAGAVGASSYIYTAGAAYGGNLWAIEFLAGFIAPPEGSEAARAELTHIVQSIRMNPAWARQQQATIEQYSQGLVANAQQTWQLGQQQVTRAQQRMQAMDQQFQAMDRIITGTSPFLDTAGQIHQLDNTKTQWFDPATGRIVGTTGASPGPAWQRMPEVPPR